MGSIFPSEFSWDGRDGGGWTAQHTTQTKQTHTVHPAGMVFPVCAVQGYRFLVWMDANQWPRYSRKSRIPNRSNGHPLCGTTMDSIELTVVVKHGS